MAIEIKQVETDGFKMKYCTFGTGSKTIVMIPGISLLSTMMFADTTAMAYKELWDDYTIYLFDRREDMPDIYSVHDMAFDTARAVKMLGIENAYFFGTSQGGMIIQVIAIEFPELVSKMVLGSTVSCVKNLESKAILKKWVELAEAGNIHELNISFAEDVYSENTFRRFKRAISAMDRMVKPEDVRRFIIMSKGIHDFDIRDRLNIIHCPVLLIGSKKDKVFDLARMKQTVDILGCESYFYDDYSHCVYDEAPDYKLRIKKFFDK